MKRAIARALLGLGLAVLMAWPGAALGMGRVPAHGAAFARAEGPARVFILHSFSENDLWAQQVDAGILEALAEAGYSADDGTLELGEYWMNAKYYTSRDYMVNIAAAAQRAIEDFEPDLVIAVDDPAIKWVVAKWNGDEELPFVFTGLIASPDEIRKLAERTNVTGVQEVLFFGRTLDWIHYILPDVERVVFLSDTTRKAEVREEEVADALAEHRLHHQEIAEHPVYLQEARAVVVETFADWQAQVLAANKEADVLVVVSYLTLVDDRGGKVDSSEVIRWTVEHSEIPVVGMSEDAVVLGALGGMVVAGDEQGQFAGQLAVRVLEGEPPAEIEMVVPRRGKLVLNTAAIQRWHVDVPISLLQVSTLYGPDGQVVHK